MKIETDESERERERAQVEKGLGALKSSPEGLDSLQVPAQRSEAELSEIVENTSAECLGNNSKRYCEVYHVVDFKTTLCIPRIVRKRRSRQAFQNDASVAGYVIGTTENGPCRNL